MTEDEIIAAIEELLEAQGRSHCHIDSAELEQLVMQVVEAYAQKVGGSPLN